MDYEAREAYKSEGWELYHKGKTADEKAKGLFMVIEAHWERARSAKTGKPTLTEYARHWLWANHDRWPGEATEILLSRYSFPSNPKIEKGCTGWGSRGRARRPAAKSHKKP